MRASTPRTAPISTGSIWGACSRRASAMARAGIRCPPVPPPAMRTRRDCGAAGRIGGKPSPTLSPSNLSPPLRGRLCRTPPPACSPASLLLSRAGSPWASSQAADIDQDSGTEQRDPLAQPAIGHERQRQTRGRNKSQRHSHVHEGGQADDTGQSHSEILSKRIRGGARDTETKPAEQREQRHHHAYPDEAPLLSNGAEEKIRVGVR